MARAAFPASSHEKTRRFIAGAVLAESLPDEPNGADDSLGSAATRLLEQAAIEPLRAVLVARSLNALAGVVARLPAASLAEAVGASSDYDVLLRALQAALPPTPDEEQKQEERLVREARVRGLVSRRRILQAEGGTVSSSAVATHLGISRQAVDERRKKGRLLALPTGSRAYAYPAWQLTREGLLDGLEEVLAALAPWDPWTQAAFLLNPNTRLQGSSPLEELRGGKLEAVVQAAQAYGEHSA